MKERLVLIGNGMAGVRTIEEIIRLEPERYEISIFGKEPYPNYNRIMLSSVLQGDTGIQDIVLNDVQWYIDQHITFHKGEAASKIDTTNRIVYGELGAVEKYDKLIIATGSNPFMLPLPGADKEGVIAFRDIKDCETMIETSKKYKKAVVIGGGLLGIEAARGLLNLNMDTTVVHIYDYLMERQLDQPAAKLLKTELEKQGMKFLMKKQTAKITGGERVGGLMFNDGTSIDADLVVMAVGIRPDAELAKASGLEVNRGIVVNDYMQTSVDHIYAVGECAEHREICYGLVWPLYEQGKVLAKHLVGRETEPYTGSYLSTKLKVSGVDVFSAGEFIDDDSTTAIKVEDGFAGIYKKVLVREQRVVGAVLFGDISEGTRIFNLIKNKTDVSGMTSNEILGIGEVTGTGGLEAVAAMPDDEIVCGCNGVSKGAIMQAIQEQGLKTVDEIKGCTNASRSCGGCKPLVSQLLEVALGDEYDAAAAQKAPLCGCTTLSREDIMAEIKSKGLLTSREVMNVLGWSQEEGCSKCRPALNYFLGLVFPEEHEDEEESRYVNERLHANIQNDGTFSVVPRMYGGVTNSEQLRKIADVADKYQVKMLKVTGGQRIDLLGIKKEDLPKIWEELGMPSGYAYGKAIRTVKTCVGTDFCRFGTQDSIQMGIDIEKKFERLNTPHKVKMAVSGCPRNCAESGIKDLGVVAIDGGWELYVGGNGGVKVRDADYLCTVKTPEEVIEYTGAYLQYYRENADYLERTSAFVERMGVKHIQELLADAETRKELNERMDKALSVLVDPWKKIVETEEERNKFELLTAAVK